MRAFAMTLIAGICSPLVLAGCARPDALSVDRAWVRLGAVTGRPAAAYFTIHGGPTPTTLIAVSTDVTIRAEMHESMKMARGAMTMAPLNRVAIPAHADIVFAPGGRHVMLFDVNPGIRPGRNITLSFAFADGTRLQASARTVGAGDPAPDLE